MIDADRYRHTGRTYVNIFGARRRYPLRRPLPLSPAPATCRCR